MAGKLKDLTGRRFGRLVVISHFTRPRSNGLLRQYWECLCDCGVTTDVRGDGLIGGDYISCGCAAIDKVSTHRGSKTPEYRSWSGIIQRCLNPKSPSFHNYGGRGIKICRRWRISFANFLADMGPRPGHEYSIERKNNSRHYTPSNCIWATPKQQSRNTRRTKLSEKKVANIRRQRGAVHAKVLAEQYGVALGTIRRVWAGSIWS